MLPIMLDARKARVGLAGAGEGLARRRTLLAEAGAIAIEVPHAGEPEIAGLDLLYVAGLERHQAKALATRARARGVLVNVEDAPELCDFHVPATVRRGDLLLAVSSAGRSPGLVRLVREWLSAQFGAEWGRRVDEIGRKRAQWRASGLSPAEISGKTRTLASWWFG